MDNPQRNWQHWAHMKQDEVKQNTTQKTNKMSNTDPTKTGGEQRCSRRVSSFVSYKTRALLLIYLGPVGHNYTQTNTWNLNKT